MTDATGQPLSLDADVLEGTSDGLQITYQTEDGETVTTIASSTEAADIVSKAFTTVADGTEANVEYITMTPEEAAAAGVVAAPEEEQVVTTSLQFDPANPSVLYTADGTPINQADLTPEEQALVQAALQQHLAEQEAEQQLAMMQEGETAPAQTGEQPAADQTAVGGDVTSSSAPQQAPVDEQPVTAAGVIQGANTDATVTSTVKPNTFQATLAEGIDLASPNTNASQIVQTLANNVRRQQMEEKRKTMSQQKPKAVVKSTPPVANYAEKIVIREGQPQVVKVASKKQPSIPEALASLMPKVEIGKDGSQVIRIHQSQITSNQLRALQDNPNVRLVFRPATTKTKPVKALPRKRGRPRKDDASPRVAADAETPEDEEPPAKTRSGRVSKRPVYTKDYLTPKSREMDEDDDTILDPGDETFSPAVQNPLIDRRGKGRPPGGKGIRKDGYAHKIETLQRRDVQEPFPMQVKPALTPIEQALSTRRKNRLREMLSACSEDEIMEVAMPHLARVFSLWEFLVTKVEKNKMSRVYFADIYKEYECLHKYVSKLAEKYKQAIEENKAAIPETSEAVAAETPKEGEEKEKSTESEEKTDENDSSRLVQVTVAKLAESLGLSGDTLLETEISLLDPEEAIGPRIMGMIGVGRGRGTSQMSKYGEDKTARKLVSATTEVRKFMQTKDINEGVKPVQTEATSTISTTQNTTMPPLRPMGQTEKVAISETITPVNGTAEGSTQPQQATETPMETDAAAATESTVATTEASETGTQLIQIGQGEDQQFIEVPEGYTLIQTPEGLVMSQPGTTIAQGEDGTIYITHADGTTTPLSDATQQAVPMETVESLLSLDGQQAQT